MLSVFSQLLSPYKQTKQNLQRPTPDLLRIRGWFFIFFAQFFKDIPNWLNCSLSGSFEQYSTKKKVMSSRVSRQNLENLPVKDVNNVHLVCRNLHQIANMHVNPILRFYRNSLQDLESLVKSSRIFEKIGLSPLWSR